MGLSRDLVREVRRMDRYDLRQLVILARGLLGHVDGPPTEAELAGVSYRQEEVSCGKDACTRCPHGPYWYAYWREDGRTRSLYIGRHRPGEPLEPVVTEDDEGGERDDGDDSHDGWLA